MYWFSTYFYFITKFYTNFKKKTQQSVLFYVSDCICYVEFGWWLLLWLLKLKV